MKTKAELLAELEQAQKRIEDLENAIASKKDFAEFQQVPAIEELRASEQLFTIMFRSNPVPVGITRVADFRILEVNDAWSALTGYTREEAVGHTSTELNLAKPQTLQNVRDNLQDQGEIHQTKILLYTRSGQEKHIQLSSEKIEIDGEFYFLNNLLDVTEQRLAEDKLYESEARFSAIFRSSPTAIIMTRLSDGQVIEANNAFLHMFGYEWEEMAGKTTLALGVFANLEDRQRLINILRETGRLKELETQFRKKSGELGDLVISAEIMEVTGERYLISMMTDITERKRTEERVRESEARLKGFLDAAPDAMVIVNTDGKIIFANLQAENLFGYKHSELFQAELEKLIPERFREAHIKNIARFFQQPQTREMGSGRELFILHKDGHEVMVEISLSHHQMDAEGVVLCAIRNITERRQAEQKIRESEEISRTFIEQSYDGIMLSDAQGKIIEWNPALAQISGLERNVTLGMNAWDVQFQMMTPEKRTQITVEQLKTGMQNVLKEEHHPKFNAPGEFEIQTPQGERKFLAQTSFPIFSPAGYRLGAIVRDITARKQADEKLHESEARFATAFFTNPAPQSILSLVTGQVLEVNEATCQLFGYNREELIGAEPGTLNLWAEPNEQVAALEELKTSGHLRPRVVTIRKKSGETRSIIFTAEQISWKTEPCLITSSLDITERKQAENALEQTRNTLEQAQKIAHMGSFEYIAATQTTLWSEEEYRIYGVDSAKPSPTYEEMLQQMIHPDDADLLHEVFTKAMQNNSIYELEHRILKPDGSIRWVHDRAVPYLDAEGKLERYIGITLDITERKEAEQKVLVSETLLRQVLESTQNATFAVDRNYRLLLNNQRHQQVLVETGGHPFQAGESVLPPDYLPEVLELWRSLYDRALNGEEFKWETKWQYPDGIQHVMENNFSPLRDVMGNINGVLVVINDITERKQVEMKLREKEEFLRMAYEAAELGIWKNDLRSGAVEFDEYSRIHYGFETGSTTLDEVTKRVHPDDVARLNLEIATATSPEGNGRFATEYRVIHPDGSVHWLDIRVRVLFDVEGVERQPTLGFGTSLDITERKLSEQNLYESERRFATIFENSPVAIGISRLSDGQIVQVNSAFIKLYGFAREEILGYTTMDLGIWANPADRQRFVELLRAHQLVSALDMTARRKSGEERQVLIWGELIEIMGQLYMVAQIVDITEIKQAERKLRESEEKYRSLMETLDSVVATIDYNGKFLYMNDIAAKALGGKAENLIGKTMQDLFPEPIASQQLEGVRWVIQEGIGRVTENITFVNGEARWFRNSLQPIHNENGQVVYALLNSTDVHELKSTQQELAELNRTLEERIKQATAEIQDLYDNAPSGYHSLDKNGCFLQINQTELNWLGYTRNEVIGRPFSDFVTEKGLSIFQQNYPAFKQRGWLRDMEMEFLRKDGSTFYTLVNAVAIKDDAGNYLMSRSSLIDITDRKKADEALKSSETKYRQLFENMNDGFSLQEIITDENGQPVDFRYLDANNLFERHSGLSPKNLIGKTARELFSQIDPHSLQNYGKVALTGEPITIEYFSALVNRYLSVRAYSPKHGQFATIFEDITERKRAKETLTESYARLDFTNRELERALHAKDEFLANMSHELRTPLNAIIGLSDSMLELSTNGLTQKEQKYLNTIRESGQHLLNLINDILDLAKAGAKQLVLEPHTVDVNSVCQASLRMIKQIATNKSLDVQFHIDPDVDFINADERRLKQMIINLLTNAVKFTPPAGQIGLEVHGDHINQQIRFTVWDTGIGISKEDQARLFQPFVQVNSSMIRDVGGTGLGLALVSEMARLHGGTVSLESELGKGSRFSFILPWSDNSATITSPQKTGSTGKLTLPPMTTHDTKQTILLVEDTETAIMTARDYLEAKGYLVVVAQNGQDGITIANQIKPDLILMDVQMPVMDGLEATRRLRAQAEFKNTPIIALTAYAMQEDHDRCLAAGATDYMSKPYKLKLLVQKIEDHLKQKNLSTTDTHLQDGQ